MSCLSRARRGQRQRSQRRAHQEECPFLLQYESRETTDKAVGKQSKVGAVVSSSFDFLEPGPFGCSS